MDDAEHGPGPAAQGGGVLDDTAAPPAPSPPEEAAPASPRRARRSRRTGSDVAVVAVRGGDDTWRRVSAYVGRAGQGVGGVPRVAFYTAKQVLPPVPLVRAVVAHVPLTAEEADRREASGDATDREVARVLRDALATGDVAWETVDVVLLSGPDDPATLDCGGVRHDGPLGWCRSRRYASLDALTAAVTTGDLGAGQPATSGDSPAPSATTVPSAGSSPDSHEVNSA